MIFLIHFSFGVSDFRLSMARADIPFSAISSSNLELCGPDWLPTVNDQSTA
jgi:hypothetical protein